MNYKKYSSILFLNADFGAAILPFQSEATRPVLIAADGAAWKMQEKDLVPDVIIGDLDSLKSRQDWKEFFRPAEIVELPGQEINDFEKALKYIEQKDLSPCMILGMQGGDLEHSYNNWSVFIKYSKRLELHIAEAGRMAFSLTAGQSLEVECSVNSCVSLIPQTSCVITTKGLKWELQNEQLALGVREGARNQNLSEKFSISVDEGSLLVFVPDSAKILI